MVEAPPQGPAEISASEEAKAWVPSPRSEKTEQVDRSVTRTSLTATPTTFEPSVPTGPDRYPIDLPTALRLAESSNPAIGEAMARIGEALATLQQARVELLPTLNAGFDYDGHTGPLQRSSGEILNVSRQSVYVGGGASAVAASPSEIPAVNIVSHLADALFDPLAARQRVDQSGFEATATANTTLLDVVTRYIDLQAAQALLAARLRTVRDAEQVVQIASAYAASGEGREADARRAQTEWKLRQAEVRQAEEQIAVAAARLAELLQLDPSVRLEPLGDPLAMVSLIDLDEPIEPLVQQAVSRRPEVKATAAAVSAAETRLRQEQARPLLPTLWMGFSGAVFGGGSNLVPPTVGDFRGRTDFDVLAYWTLQNFGLGNLAHQRERAAGIGEAVGEQARAIAEVRSEVAAALGQAQSQRRKIERARESVALASDGFLHDLERIRQAAQARPIEVLNNLNQLKRGREAYIDAVAGYNRAQFRLYVALGSPPPLEAPSTPLPPPTLASDSESGQGVDAEGPPAPAAAAVETRQSDGREARMELAGLEEDAVPEDQSRAGNPNVQALSLVHRNAVEAARRYDRAQEALAGASKDRRNALVEEVARAHKAVVESEVAFARLLRRFETEEPGSSDR